MNEMDEPHGTDDKGRWHAADKVSKQQGRDEPMRWNGISKQASSKPDGVVP